MRDLLEICLLMPKLTVYGQLCDHWYWYNQMLLQLQNLKWVPYLLRCLRMYKVFEIGNSSSGSDNSLLLLLFDVRSFRSLKKHLFTSWKFGTRETFLCTFQKKNFVGLTSFNSAESLYQTTFFRHYFNLKCKNCKLYTLSK